VGPRASLDMVTKKFLPLLGIELCSSSPQPVTLLTGYPAHSI